MLSHALSDLTLTCGKTLLDGLSSAAAFLGNAVQILHCCGISFLDKGYTFLLDMPDMNYMVFQLPKRHDRRYESPLRLLQ